MTIAPSPLPDDIDLQKEWETAWTKARESFSKHTKLDLTGQRLQPDQVLDLLRQKQVKADKSSKFDAVAAALEKTLQLLTTIGQIAGQAASMVFGPADMAINAVSFVLKIGHDYTKVYEDLAALFSRISDALDRFRVYQGMQDVSIELKRIANQVLLCFVDVCKLSVEILQHPVKTFGRTLLGSDSGVQGKLGELEEIAIREQRMVSTQTYESAKSTERLVNSASAGISELQESGKAAQRKLDTTSDGVTELRTDSQKKKLLERLGKPSRDAYEKPLAEIRKNRVPNTGQWLLENRLFRLWTDWRKPVNPILGLVGKKGYGKSCLVATAIEELRRQYPHGRAADSSRVSIACFFFEEKTQQGQPRNSLEQALKSIAAQLLEDDPVYLKELASASERSDDTANATLEPLWRRLLIKVKADSTFFVLLDGVDAMQKEHLKMFMPLVNAIQQQWKTGAQPRVRLLISGRVEVIDDIEGELERRLPRIDVAKYSEDDIQRFIHDRMDRMAILKGNLPQLKDLRTEISDKLVQTAGGDFTNVNMLLFSIEKKRSPDDIRKVLDESGSGSGLVNTITRAIEEANESLQPQEIRDLNCLLTWLVANWRGLKVLELKSLLYFKNQQVSLRPLSVDIREKYSSFLAIDGDEPAQSDEDRDYFVVLKESIEEFFRNRDTTKTARLKDELSSERMTKSEIKMLTRHLQIICDEEMFVRFGFKDFFDQKLGSSSAAIDVDLDTAGLDIATTCLQVLCMENNEEWAQLNEFAVDSFADMLLGIDYSRVDPVRKMELGNYLIKLFTQDAFIQRWWMASRAVVQSNTWLFDDGAVGGVLKCLNDPGVAAGLSEADREWVLRISGKSGPPNLPTAPNDVEASNGRLPLKEDLMHRVIQLMAHQWLIEGGWDGLDPKEYGVFEALDPLYAYWRIQQSSRLLLDASRRLDHNVGSEEISDLFGWAWYLLGNPLRGSRWLQCEAQAYARFNYGALAVDHFRKGIAQAEEEKKQTIDLRIGLAEALAVTDDYTSAIKTLESTLDQAEPSLPLTEDDRKRRQKSYGLLGAWKEKDQPDEALDYYRKQLESDWKAANGLGGAYELLRVLCRQEKWADMIKFFQTSETEWQTGTKVDRVTCMHVDFCEMEDSRDNDSFQNWLLKAGRQMNELDMVRNCYTRAVEGFKALIQAGNKPPLRLIEYYQARFWYKHPRSDEERSAAVELWDEISTNDITPNENNDKASLAKSKATDDLAGHYFEEFRAQSHDREPLEKLAELGDRDRSVRPLLCRGHQMLGEEREARDAVRDKIKDGLEMLLDDDASNDQMGYASLINGLLPCGDDVNTIAAYKRVGAAWYATVAQPEQQEDHLQAASDAATSDGKTTINPESSAASGSNEPTANGTSQPVAANGSSGQLQSTQGMSWPGLETPVLVPAAEVKASSRPDGPLYWNDELRLVPAAQVKAGWRPDDPLYWCNSCYKYWDQLADFYTCADCLEMDLCPSCAEKVQQDSPDVLVCRADHKRLRIPGLTAQPMTDVGENDILVGDRILPLKQWLREIANEWGLSISDEGNVEALDPPARSITSQTSP